MRRSVWFAFVLLLVSMGLGPLVLAQRIVSDRNEIFTVEVPTQWIYQVNESTDSLLVFYGPGENELLYIEILPNVLDDQAYQFAARVIDAYKGPGGPYQFQVEGDFLEISFFEESAVSIIYSYELPGGILQTGSGVRQWEERVFFLGSEEGFSITYSNSKDDFEQGRAILKDISATWRWISDVTNE